MRSFLEPGDKAYWPNLLDPIHRRGKTMTVLDRNKIRKSYNRRDPRYHKIKFTQYLVDGLAENLVTDMHNNISDDWDNMVVISGGEGTGKSHLAYHIAKLFDPNFNLDDGLVYGYEELVSRVAKGRAKGSVIWMDEATLIAGKRDWQKEDNKTFINILETYRSYGFTIIMCIPDKDRLDVYIREDRMRYHLIAKKMSWENDPETKRGYYELQDEKGKTMGYGKYPLIPEPDRTRYEEIKRAHQRQYADEIQERLERKKNGGAQNSRWIEIAIRGLIEEHDHHGMSWEELAAIYDIPASTLRRQAAAYKKRLEG